MATDGRLWRLILLAGMLLAVTFLLALLALWIFETEHWSYDQIIAVMAIWAVLGTFAIGFITIHEGRKRPPRAIYKSATGSTDYIR
ncbi:MAG: hypothetical protein WB778_04945 [Thermoplasmata archaeon]